MGWVFIGATCEFDSTLGTASLGGPVETLHATQTLDHSPRWGPDGQYVVASIYRDYYRRSVYLAAADGSAVRRVFIDTDGTQASPSITSDGRIVFLEYVYKPRSGFVDGPSTPHYEAVGVANPDGTIQSEIPVPAFKVVGESGEMEAARFNHPSILPGTNRIVAMVSYRWIDGDAGIHEVVAPGNTRLLSATEGSSVLEDVEVSPDGDRIAYRQWHKEGDNWKARVAIIRMDGTGVPIYSSSTPKHSNISNIAWTPDNSRVIFATWEGESCIAGGTSDIVDAQIWSMNADGSGVELAAGLLPPFPIESIKPSPTGYEFAMVVVPRCGEADNAFKIWSSGRLRDLIIGCCKPTEARGISWSPDGSRIAVLYDTNTPGDVLRTVKPDGSGVTTLIRREADGSLVPGR